MSSNHTFLRLKASLEETFDPMLDLRFCRALITVTTAFSKRKIARYYMKLENEVIWDFPANFHAGKLCYHAWTVDGENGIPELVEEYISTPVNQLPGLYFEKDGCKRIVKYLGRSYQDNIDVRFVLTDILKAADKRLGRNILHIWAETTKSPVVERILFKRFPNHIHERFFTSGRLVKHGDSLSVKTESGNLIGLNISSMSGKSFKFNERLSGFIEGDLFSVCRWYKTRKGENYFGYISKDEIHSDYIYINAFGSDDQVVMIHCKRNDIINYFTHGKKVVRH